MAKLLNRLFPALVSGRLPAEVESVINNISVNVRSHEIPEMDTPARVILFGLAGSPFVANYQSIKRRIEWAFPDLNEKQVTRAVRWVQAEITNHLRASKPQPRSKAGWLHNW